MTSSVWARGPRLAWLAIVAIAASFGLAACGSSSSSSSSTTSSSSSSTGSSGGSQAATDAKKVVDMADGKLVYSTVEEPSSPADIVPYGTWRGPKSAPKHEAGKRVDIIVCTKASVACVGAAQGAQDAAKQLGWSAQILDGKGTPQGFSSAFDTAIADHANAVITIAVPTAAVGDNIAKLKKAGIISVGVGDKEPSSGTKYDAYVPFPMPLMNAVLAYADIARTKGAAKTIVVQDPGFPVLIQSADEYTKILGTCSGCKSWSLKWQITDAANPTKANSIISGALSQHPDATTLDLPYAIGLPSATQAAQATGKKLTIYAKDADEVGLKAVADGSIAANAGSSVVWAGWAGVDQVVRGLGKAPYLGPTQTGLGVALFTKSTVPSDGNIDNWSGLVDFKSEYKKIWK